MIEVKGLHKSFGKNHVLKGIEVQFEPGKITAVLGPNSSGKTTLIKSILGMVHPDDGKILMDDLSVIGQSAYRKNIGYLPQIARFPENITVKELFQMIENVRGQVGKKDDLIELFNLQNFLDHRLGTLSGGTRQKVNIVQAFMFDTPYLLLDEPTAGLDPLSLVKLKQLIRDKENKSKTIIITSHIMSFVEEMADKAIFILEGKVHFSGEPKQLMSEYLCDSLEASIAKILEGIPSMGHSNGQKRSKSHLTTSK